MKSVADAQAYWIDTLQRSVLFMDIMRKRGNNFLDIIEKGQPPVLTFDYTIIMDGRSLDRPVNHDLALILPEKEGITDPEKRPIVVVDPRAGHGPGIGGSKQDSEIGMALKHGHPVYFILFYPDPEPGQTYGDVKDAQARFVEEVRHRHPKAPEPALIGNCQAGWAVALLSADRPDISGPIVLNGSPLSYWAGVDGKNPMRYRGGLMGGTWMTSLVCDLGNGKFDGANLVMNFENLNPANTFWTKQYTVWANVDTEEKRYLDFEKWWNSYFMMNADEIHFIVKNLFVENRLEQGEVELDKGRKINLKNLQDPVLVFASSGDNITPPQQALNWIAKVYGSVDEIKRCQQVIIYRVHKDIGHLGIFVSGKVAKKEHKEIIEHIDHIDYLPPGLYELVIEEGEKIIEENGEELRLTDYIARFEERDISDILAMDDGFEDEAEFATVAAVSEANDRFYETWLSPWMRIWSNNATAEFLKWMHPMRASRYLFSDKNPFMLPFKTMAPVVRERRMPADTNNIFAAMERQASEQLVTMLNTYREVRDESDGFLFKRIYRNPWLTAAFPSAKPTDAAPVATSPAGMTEAERDTWIDKINKGGIPAGIVRVIVMMAGADHVFDEREFEAAAKIVRESQRFEDMPLAEFKQLAKEQARILQIDEDRALNALRWLLPQQAHRREAYEVAEKISMADFALVDEEKALLERLTSILQIDIEVESPAPVETPSENMAEV
ncbi:DUF3141 domain-containing protein [Desulfococcus sp.]|uniref:DUF3141 domain-containing protein n=1 Tax=Desulfococcus sp. TaxID=2025834 RepID=UPI0035934EC4